MRIVAQCIGILSIFGLGMFFGYEYGIIKGVKVGISFALRNKKK